MNGIYVETKQNIVMSSKNNLLFGGKSMLEKLVLIMCVLIIVAFTTAMGLLLMDVLAFKEIVTDSI